MQIRRLTNPWDSLGSSVVVSHYIDWATLGYAYKQENLSGYIGNTDTELMTIGVSHFPTGAIFESIGGAEFIGSDIAPDTRVWLGYGNSDSLRAGGVTTWGRGYFSVGTFVKTSEENSLSLYARVDRDDASSQLVSGYISVKRVG